MLFKMMKKSLQIPLCPVSPWGQFKDVVWSMQCIVGPLQSLNKWLCFSTIRRKQAAKKKTWVGNLTLFFRLSTRVTTCHICAEVCHVFSFCQAMPQLCLQSFKAASHVCRPLRGASAGRAGCGSWLCGRWKQRHWQPSKAGHVILTQCGYVCVNRSSRGMFVVYLFVLLTHRHQSTSFSCSTWRV